MIFFFLRQNWTYVKRKQSNNGCRNYLCFYKQSDVTNALFWRWKTQQSRIWSHLQCLFQKLAFDIHLPLEKSDEHTLNRRNHTTVTVFMRELPKKMELIIISFEDSNPTFNYLISSFYFKNLRIIFFFLKQTPLNTHSTKEIKQQVKKLCVF